VRAPDQGQLHDRELKIYEYIASNFLACISKDATYIGVRATLNIGDEDFKLKGQIVVNPGFLEVMPWQQHADKEIPNYQVGDVIDVKSTKITESRTEAPGYLTEADLIE
jgi:DNA topoisomerase-3